MKEAVDRVHNNDRLTTIVVGKGEHLVGGPYLRIWSAMNIVGDPEVPKETIVVLGGIFFQEMDSKDMSSAAPDTTCTSSKEKWSDVNAVCARVVGTCYNVEMRECGKSGVVAVQGACITLIDTETMATTVVRNRTSNSKGRDEND